MKIIQIIPTLGSGGAERFVIDLCNELTKQGNQVILCTLYNLDSNKEYAFFKENLNQNIECINLDKKLGFDSSLFLKIYKTIKKHKPQVVHSHLSTLNYLMLSILFFNVKFIHTLHSDAKKLIKNKGEYFLRKIIYNTKLVKPICISEESLDSYCKLYKNRNAGMIYNGRALPIINETWDLGIEKEKYDTIFLHVGRYDEAKNQVNLLKAFNIVLSKKPNQLLLIIGDGDEKIKEELLFHTNNRIVFLGRKSNVNDYMEISDAFILPSIFEGMPISLIEAMSHGLISIVTDVGGMKNMINDGVNGIKIKGTTKEDIETALIKYLNLTDEEKKRIKQYSKLDFQEKYSIEKCVKYYIEEYGF